MIKTLERTINRAIFMAESDTRKRRAFPSLKAIEKKLTRNILAQSLALQAIKNVNTPMSILMAELQEIESEVSKFVAEAIKQAPGEHKLTVDVRGVLVGAVGMIPSHGIHRKKEALKVKLLTYLRDKLNEQLPKAPASPINAQAPQSEPMPPAPTVRNVGPIKPVKKEKARARKLLVGKSKKKSPKKKITKKK